MAENNKENNESEDLTNEILYGKKNGNQTKDFAADGDELMDEILYGKKKPKTEKTEKKEGSSSDNDEADSVNEILYGKKKSKSEATEKAEKPAGKKFDREEYFGL